MKTITATIPAQTIKLSAGKTRTVPARTETLAQDDAGRWTIDLAGKQYPMTEGDAIDLLRKASNWAAIRAEHFPMHGFHA